MDIRTHLARVDIGGTAILEDASVEARAGEFLVLAGPSGSGKTTLLNVLGLLTRVDGGKVFVDDVDATKWRDARRRQFWQRHVAFVFQDYGLIEEATVEYNVTVARRSLFGLPKGERGRAERVLEHVLLGGRGKEQAARLSGGEKQRVGLARAMYRKADVVLADEPTASLDRANRQLVISFLREEAQRGATVIAATHDDEVMDAADHVVELASTTATRAVG